MSDKPGEDQPGDDFDPNFPYKTKTNEDQREVEQEKQEESSN